MTPTPNNEALAALLDEVRQHFTRDDDLPNDLLPRIDAALSSGQAASAVPEGWKLVPINPTPEMIAAADAGDHEYTRRCFGPSMPTMQQSGEDHWSAMLAASPTQPASAPAREGATLRERLQQRCSDWGVYWRASDAHGVDLSHEQALDLLRDALGVEVEIATPAAPAQPREAQAQAAELVDVTVVLFPDGTNYWTDATAAGQVEAAWGYWKSTKRREQLEVYALVGATGGAVKLRMLREDYARIPATNTSAAIQKAAGEVKHD